MPSGFGQECNIFIHIGEYFIKQCIIQYMLHTLSACIYVSSKKQKNKKKSYLIIIIYVTIYSIIIIR